MYSRQKPVGHKTFKSILITGASSGIGKAIAISLSEKGVTILLTGRNKGRLDTTALACINKGATVHTKVLSVTDREKMKKMIQEYDEKYKFDLVVANAGIGANTIDEVHWAVSSYKMVDVNINGVLNTILPMITLFQDRKKGHVAIVGSLTGYVSMPPSGIYSGTKACVRHICQELRPLLRHWNIDISLISPGYTNSRLCPKEFNKECFGFIMEDEAAKIIKNGLESNEFNIDFPSKVFNTAYLVGSFHPYLQTFLPWNKSAPRDSAAQWIGRRFEFDPNDEFGGEC